MRFALLLLFLLAPCGAAAQDAPSDAATETEPSAPGDEAVASGEGETSSPEGEAPALRPPDDALRPKIAIVLLGDPDPEALAAVDALSAALDGEVRFPSDPAISAALTGRGGGDGLDDLRSERRGLGLSERRDLPTLVRLGRLASAVALVLVRPNGETLEIVVLDVGREAFFDGTLALPAEGAELVRFVGRRVRAADTATHGTSAAAPPEEPREETSPVDEEPAAETPSEGTAETAEEAPEEPGDPVLHWFEENWAYLAAGALLAGGIVFVVVVATDPGAPQPMLRFTPGAMP